LKKTGKVAIGKIAFSGREHVLAIAPAGDEDDRGGMIAYTLRYAAEVRNQNDYFRDIKQTEISEDSLELAETLIAKRSSKLDMSKFEDGYEVALKELVDAKLKHLPIPKDEVVQPSRGNVVNLMDALRNSIRNADTSAGTSRKKPAASVASPSKSAIGLVKGAAKKSAKRKSA
jgi:DNA end-binding protein Ku